MATVFIAVAIFTLPSFAYNFDDGLDYRTPILNDVAGYYLPARLSSTFIGDDGTDGYFDFYHYWAPYRYVDEFDEELSYYYFDYNDKQFWFTSLGFVLENPVVVRSNGINYDEGARTFSVGMRVYIYDADSLEIESNYNIDEYPFSIDNVRYNYIYAHDGVIGNGTAYASVMHVSFRKIDYQPYFELKLVFRVNPPSDYDIVQVTGLSASLPKELSVFSFDDLLTERYYCLQVSRYEVKQGAYIPTFIDDSTGQIGNIVIPPFSTPDSDVGDIVGNINSITNSGAFNAYSSIFRLIFSNEIIFSCLIIVLTFMLISFILYGKR